jgi:hypothetical protein
MTESVLQALGAIPEQIDRERERVRSDLFGNPVPAQAIEPRQGQSTTDSKVPPVPEGQEVLSDPSNEPSGKTSSRSAGPGAAPPPEFDQIDIHCE